MMLTVFVPGQAPIYTGSKEWNPMEFHEIQQHKLFKFEAVMPEKFEWTPLISIAITFVCEPPLCVHNDKGQANLFLGKLAMLTSKGKPTTTPTKNRASLQLPREKTTTQPGSSFWWPVWAEKMAKLNVTSKWFSGHGLNGLNHRITRYRRVSKKLLGSTSASHHSWQDARLLAPADVASRGKTAGTPL